MKYLSILFVSFVLVSCSISPKIDYSQMPYDSIPYEIFDKMPHDLQYKIKYPNDNDNIITMEREVSDTIFETDGITPKRLGKKTIVDSLYLKKDSIIFYPPFANCKAQLSFFTAEKVFDKKKKEFTDYFNLEFTYDKKNKYLFLLKSELPSMDSISIVHPFRYTPSVYYGIKKGVTGNYSTEYRLSETHTIYKGSLGKDSPDHDLFILEENEISKIVKYIDYKEKKY